MNQTRKRKTKKNNKKCKYNKTAKLKPENCSPTSKYKYTCYSNKSLHLLKRYWNFRHPDCKITTNDNYKIWVQLKNYMYYQGKKFHCKNTLRDQNTGL